MYVIRYFLMLFIILFVTRFNYSDSSSTKTRSVTKIADNIYMIRHQDAPDGFPQGNTTVIIGEKEVLVVDACYLPSSAKEDIEQIRTWTSKPISYLVNTHWHYDHTMGNGIYAEEIPSIKIIAHEQTRGNMIGYNPGWFQRFPGRAAIFQKYLDEGKDASGKELTEDDRKVYADAIAGIQPVHEEFKKLTDRVPEISFSDELNIDLGGVEVQIMHLGRGNTAGDAIVYLPKEKLIITGDLLDHPIPYLGGGYPVELVTTLTKISHLDFNIIIPGHGEVLYGKEFLHQVIDFVSLVVNEVSRQIHLIGNGPQNLEKVREAVMKEIDVAYWRQKFAGDNKDDQDFFDGFSMRGIVTAAYAELWKR